MGSHFFFFFADQSCKLSGKKKKKRSHFAALLLCKMKTKRILPKYSLNIQSRLITESVCVFFFFLAFRERGTQRRRRSPVVARAKVSAVARHFRHKFVCAPRSVYIFPFQIFIFLRFLWKAKRNGEREREREKDMNFGLFGWAPYAHFLGYSSAERAARLLFS